MIPLRLELRTACVLDRSDNQLHHRTNLMEGVLSRNNIATLHHEQVSQQVRGRWRTAHVSRVAVALSGGRKHSEGSHGISHLRLDGAGDVSAVLTHPPDYSPPPLLTLGERWVHVNDGVIERVQYERMLQS
jgi:hypothetical protein